MRKCAECGAAAIDNSQFCRECGAKLSAEAIKNDVMLCRSCQEPIEAGERFCGNCGQATDRASERSDTQEGTVEAVDDEAADEGAVIAGKPVELSEDETNEEEPPVSDEPAESTELENEDEPEQPATLPGENTDGQQVSDAPQEQAAIADSPRYMFCPKCGSQLSGNAVFCRHCGHNIELSRHAIAAAPAPAAVPAASYMPPPPPPDWHSSDYASPPPAAQHKKKRKGLLIGLIIILIIALLAGMTYLLAGRIVRRLILGNKATYLAIEGQQLRQDAADLAEWLADLGNASARPAAGGHIVQFNVDLNDNAMLMDPVMQTALENITWRSQIIYDLETSPAQYFASLELLTASEPLLSIEGYYDQEQLIIGLPGLLSQYLWAQRNTIDEYAGGMGLDAEETDQVLGALDLMLNLDMGIDEPALLQSLFTIIDIMLSHIDQVEFTAKQDLSVGPVNEQYDRFTMTISDENAYLMLKEILEVMRDDTEIFNLVSGMSELGQSIDPDSFAMQPTFTLEQWQRSIDLLLAELDRDWENSEPFTIVQDIYVDKSDQIFGRDLKILDQTGAVEFRYENYRPEADDQAGVLVRLTSDGEVMEYRNIYRFTGGKRDGSLTLSNNNQLYLEINYSQYEKAAVGSRNYILGDFTISLHDQPGSNSPTVIQFQGTLIGEQIAVKLGTPELGSIQIIYQEIAQQDVVFPTYSRDQLVDVNDWQAMARLMTEETMSELFRIIDQLGFDPGILYE